MKRGVRLILVLAPVFLAISPLANSEIISNSMVADDVEYYVQADNSIYDLGQDVDTLFRVTNLGQETLQFNYMPPLMDILAGTTTGEVFDEIWNWSWDQIYPPGPAVFELLPDESVELSGIWPQIDLNGSVDPTDHTPVPPGVYTISGIFYPTDSSVAVDITIVPEPCSLALLLGGMTYIMTKRNRKKANISQSP